MINQEGHNNINQINSLLTQLGDANNKNLEDIEKILSRPDIPESFRKQIRGMITQANNLVGSKDGEKGLNDLLSKATKMKDDIQKANDKKK